MFVEKPDFEAGNLKEAEKPNGHAETMGTVELPTTPESKRRNSISILEAMKLRLGRKQWRTRIKLLQPHLCVSLLSESNEDIVETIISNIYFKLLSSSATRTMV